ncbi:MAG: DUF4390 domain-containing protein [Betaproteobacteria bacterium]|nr:DUF4390 domain-containing protein [Betaproteobacteria bacterium]
MRTTVSSTPCWKSAADFAAAAAATAAATGARLARAWALQLALIFTPLVVNAADNASVLSARLDASEDGWQVNADFELSLAPQLFEAVRKGVPLYFAAEFELTRGRWYWIDQKLVDARRERRVSFTPLTDQYRVATSGISQTLTNAEDVTRLLARIRSWTVAERGQLKNGERYEAALRFRLDSAQLPKPFQLNVLTSREWSVSTDWHRWTVTP